MSVNYHNGELFDIILDGVVDSVQIVLIFKNLIFNNNLNISL